MSILNNLEFISALLYTNRIRPFKCPGRLKWKWGRLLGMGTYHMNSAKLMYFSGGSGKFAFKTFTGSWWEFIFRVESVLIETLTMLH